MPAYLRTFSLLILLAASAAAQNVRLTWVGQACFYIQSEGGPTVVVDPPAASVGYTLPQAAADVVAVSHSHSDHNNFAGVRGTVTRVDGSATTARTEVTAADMPFVQIPGFHDNTNGSARGRNTIVRWTQSGLRFAHFGDYGQDALTAEQLADLNELDVAMFPGGGFFTPDGTAIARLIDQVKPRVAILMHYKTGLGGPAQLAGHPAVTAPFPQIRYKPASLILARASLPATNEVWAMEPLSDAVVTPAASFVAGTPMAPGAIATIFGEFTGSATTGQNALPLPRKLGETEVFVGTEAVPLFYVSPGQINFQVPARLTGGQDVAEVRVGGQRVARGVLTTVASSPEVFLAVDQAGRINRVKRGEFLTIYASGQGVVSPAVADGAAPSANPLSNTAAFPTVRAGSATTKVQFSGLAPGYPGLWQINAEIPADAPTGPVDLIVSYSANLPSRPVTITIE